MSRDNQDIFVYDIPFRTSLQFAQDIQEDKTPTADPFSALEKKPAPSTKSSGEVKTVILCFT